MGSHYDGHKEEIATTNGDDLDMELKNVSLA